ncbi:hypothetical protein BTHERMOSOX_469 [Bathymodiolus thermophilus thioautotrophic gill symbiont]|nr:hypothetical protein BTHERMOSOX_469 [Bathymodiolus thermophilus thioautotrophic gill symbiont]
MGYAKLGDYWGGDVGSSNGDVEGLWLGGVQAVVGGDGDWVCAYFGGYLFDF